MPSTINADNGVVSGSAGLKSAADSSGVLQLQTNGTTAVTVDTSQNVGIGTSSPGAKLEIGLLGVFRMQTGATVFNVTPTVGANDYLVWNTSNALSGFAWNTNSTERMRLDPNGNLGVGTTSPVVKLQSAGDILVPSAGGYLSNIYYSGSWKYAGNGFGWAQSENSGAWTWQYAANNTSGAGAAASPTERMRIDTSGNLLVGTTAVDGTAGVSIKPNITEGTTQILFNRTTRTTTSYPLDFRNAGNSVGNISYTNTGTTYSTTSDYRLKEDVQPMTGALAKVAALKPVTYKWKSDGSDGEGFIAHELSEVVPQCVTGEKDAVDDEGKPKYQSIDTSFLVATLTAAIQELKAEVDSLKSQLAAKG